MEERKRLSWDYHRRYGAEIELNGFSEKKPNQILPEGAGHVANLVQSTLRTNVVMQRYGHNHNNSSWVVKPDGSCGMEVCSPVNKGWLGLKDICRVVEAFGNDKKIRADHRCSLHLHVEGDVNENIQAALAWWVKCEAVFIDSVPINRKRNRYCMSIGMMDDIACDMFPFNWVEQLGETKYLSANAFHWRAGERYTLEFRLMEGDGCLNPYAVKNWVRLLIHFVERAVERGLPQPYRSGDPWTGCCWLDPLDVFSFLGFDGKHELSAGMKQVKSWFLHRLIANGNVDMPGIFGGEARRFAYNQYKQLVKSSGLNIYPPKNVRQALYGDNFRL